MAAVAQRLRPSSESGAGLFGQTQKFAAMQMGIDPEPFARLPNLRQLYVMEVRSLEHYAEGALQAGENLESVARSVHAQRSALKLKYRTLTPADKVGQMEARNAEKYLPESSLRHELPDASAARALQEEQMAQGIGEKWNRRSNSCATTLCAVLSAGGRTDVPTNPADAGDYLRRGFQ
ncbi:hypothetical protein ACNOYE_21100 [Nannocystaceae bacterium ST9]